MNSIGWPILIMIIMLLGPVMGAMKGIENGSIANTLLSVFIPIYGIVYFFVASDKTTT